MAESENELALSPVPDVPIAYNSPDQILTVLGPKNPYIILVWLSMGAVWGFSAMPMMESAFIMAECGVGVDRCGVVQNCSSEHNSTIFREDWQALGPLFELIYVRFDWMSFCIVAHSNCVLSG